MSFFIDFINSVIYFMFPLLIYLVYRKHNSELLFSICLIFSVLLQIFAFDKYSILLYIPLFISIYSNKKSTSLFIIIMLFIIETYAFNMPFYLIIIELLIYYLIYYISLYKKRLYKAVNICFLVRVFIVSFYITIECVFANILIVFVKLFIMSLGGYLIMCYFLKKEKNILVNYDNELKDVLFTVIHEIKNPLSVCRGYLSMFDINNKETSKRYISIINSELDRSISLLNDCMDLSKMKITKEVLDINLLLEDVINTLNYLFINHSIETKFNINDEEIYVLGDYNRLKQAFINLLKNSFESLDSSKKMIIGINTSVQNNRIIIEIYDNGIGMTSEELKKMEEIYFTTKVIGSGIGIYFVKNIIKLHNGKIHFKSTKNRGTSVFIELNIYDEFK